MIGTISLFTLRRPALRRSWRRCKNRSLHDYGRGTLAPSLLRESLSRRKIIVGVGINHFKSWECVNSETCYITVSKISLGFLMIYIYGAKVGGLIRSNFNTIRHLPINDMLLIPPNHHHSLVSLQELLLI